MWAFFTLINLSHCPFILLCQLHIFESVEILLRMPRGVGTASINLRFVSSPSLCSSCCSPRCKWACLENWNIWTAFHWAWLEKEQVICKVCGKGKTRSHQGINGTVNETKELILESDVKIWSTYDTLDKIIITALLWLPYVVYLISNRHCSRFLHIFWAFTTLWVGIITLAV